MVPLSLQKLVTIVLFFASVNVASAGKLIKKRPDEFVPKAILTYGCIPWVDFQCPAKMHCYIDPHYPYWGQCFCKSVYQQRMKPPYDTGTELYRPPGKHDCVNMGTINILGAFIFGIYFIVTVKLFGSSSLTLYRVWKHGGLKNNSSTLALILLMLTAAFYSCTMFMMFVNRAGWDPNYKINDAIYYPCETGYFAVFIWKTLECVCTWFDLWQKSVNMSRKSSSAVFVIRWLLRAYAITFSIVWLLYRVDLIPALRGRADYVSKLNNIANWITISATGVFGTLIRRILCKNMKEVTNPNWKAAEAIRVTAFNTVLCNFFALWPLQLIKKYTLGMWAPLTIDNCFVITLYGIVVVHEWTWFHYLLYSQRRYLESYDTDRMSNYFGFTTIGLKGSRASSIVSSSSQKSSVVKSSVTSSSVAMSSTIDADNYNTTKDTSTAEPGNNQPTKSSLA